MTVNFLMKLLIMITSQGSILEFRNKAILLNQIEEMLLGIKGNVRGQKRHMPIG